VRRAELAGTEPVEEAAEMQAVAQARSGAGVEPTQRGAATPHRFLKLCYEKVHLRTEAAFRVTRPGGRVLVLAYGSLVEFEALQVFIGALKAVAL
jgi:hypothetical protein